MTTLCRKFEASNGFHKPISTIALLPDTIPAGPIDLRRWRPSDVDGIVEAVTASLAELRVWMPWAKEHPATDVYTDVVSGFDAAFDTGAEFVFGMFEVPGFVIVGSCGLHFRRGPGVAEVGYWVRSDRQRRGYATAAARALTIAAFRHLDDVGAIHITMDKANTASAGVAAKLGYELGQEEDREVLAPGHTGRGLRWVVKRADWPSST